jgi:L-seryl-tRNA(Ser) seleniumtransferase
MTASLRDLPSIDRLLKRDDVASLMDSAGSGLVTAITRSVLAGVRAAAQRNAAIPAEGEIARQVVQRVADAMESSLRPVYNLTGTVLHTNLGRASLPEAAIAAMTTVARGACNLEFDIDAGKRGDRDTHLEDWLCRLTGAEAATAVNNNAAAVLIVLNSLALRKEVPVSTSWRGPAPNSWKSGRPTGPMSRTTPRRSPRVRQR